MAIEFSADASKGIKAINGPAALKTTLDMISLHAARTLAHKSSFFDKNRSINKLFVWFLLEWGMNSLNGFLDQQLAIKFWWKTHHQS